MATTSAPPRRPRLVLWVTTDHMRHDSIGANGSPWMHTPVMDGLVERGVSFDNCFVQSPVCMPSRSSFMTGLYPQQTGVLINGHSLPQDFYPTAPRIFSGAGYASVQLGKLHLQPHEENDLDSRPRNDYGFDIFWGSEEPGCYFDAYIRWLQMEFPEHWQKLLIARSSAPDRMRCSLPGDEFVNTVLDVPWEASYSGWIATMASRYLANAFRRTRHQFMHLGFYAPHPPMNPTREMMAPYEGVDIPDPRLHPGEADDKPDPLRAQLGARHDWTLEHFRDYRRHFAGMTTGVDFALGRIIDQLKAAGLYDDTLIVLTSDHGDMCGDHGMVEKGYSFYYDECVRVPLVMHWPKAFGEKGRRESSLVEMVDILPTLADLGGIIVPEMLPGRSWAPELLSGSPVEGHESALAFAAEDGDNESAMIVTRDWKYIRWSRGRGEVLFRRDDEPREVRNRAGDEPEVLAAHRDILLERLLKAGRSYREHHYVF
ncbi:MAG: sulfatase-like hydrolase/transferase [Opitutales bacterium]|nr:sulfatase-like hydrolase/transferase [Opitutales bacterium]